MKIGKLKVKLDKPYYVAGEAVTGVIYLSNIAPILVRSRSSRKEYQSWRSFTRRQCPPRDRSS